jgi:hypothetical protein
MPATKSEHHAAETKVEKVVERILDEDLPKSASGNAAYWIGVVLGAFALNLGLLLLFARA